MHKFEYDGSTVYTKEFDLEELGQVCLEAMDNESLFYYLIVRTSLGQSSILEYGPLAPDSEILPDTTAIKFQRVEFGPARLKKIIRMFLAPRNKGRNRIEAVRQLEIEEALSYGVNLLDYIKDFNDTSNY